jgi:hypothetical protein
LKKVRNHYFSNGFLLFLADFERRKIYESFKIQGGKALSTGPKYDSQYEHIKTNSIFLEINWQCSRILLPTHEEKHFDTA